MKQLFIRKKFFIKKVNKWLKNGKIYCYLLYTMSIFSMKFVFSVRIGTKFHLVFRLIKINKKKLCNVIQNTHN